MQFYYGAYAHAIDSHIYGLWHFSTIVIFCENDLLSVLLCAEWPSLCISQVMAIVTVVWAAATATVMTMGRKTATVILMLTIVM